LAPFHVSLV